MRWFGGCLLSLCLALGARATGFPPVVEGMSTPEAWAFEEVRARALVGDPDAMLALSRRYLHGRGVARDDAAHRHWLSRAARAGQHEAQFQLGQQHVLAWALGGLSRDDARLAFDWFCLAAEGGEVDAMTALSTAYERGMGPVPRDPARALAWAIRAERVRGSTQRRVLVRRLDREFADARSDAESLAAAWARGASAC